MPRIVFDYILPHDGVHYADVIGLVEVIGCEFPVAVNFHFAPDDTLHFLHFAVGEMIGQGREILKQRLRVRIHAVPDKASPDIALQFYQFGLAARAAISKVFWVRSVLKHPVLTELPAVVGASETLHSSGITPDQAISAVGAYVIERTVTAVILPNDEHGFLHEVMNHIIARLFHLCFTCAYMPDAGPHMLPFLSHELAGPIAIP